MQKFLQILTEVPFDKLPSGFGAPPFSEASKRRRRRRRHRRRSGRASTGSSPPSPSLSSSSRSDPSLSKSIINAKISLMLYLRINYVDTFVVTFDAENYSSEKFEQISVINLRNVFCKPVIKRLL